MVVGFLVPVGMALSEWAIRPASLEERASLAGRIQILLPFGGGRCRCSSAFWRACSRW